MYPKILVCITIQENSRRLIDQGLSLSKIHHAPLHILHIRKGDTIFDNPDSSSLLEDLFAYGGELGGEVHFLCSNDIPHTIKHFIRENGITHLVMGEAPADLAQSSGIYNELKVEFDNLSKLEITVLPRENSQNHSQLS